jgi:hypothetical protein
MQGSCFGHVGYSAHVWSPASDDTKAANARLLAAIAALAPLVKAAKIEPQQRCRPPRALQAERAAPIVL